MRAARQAAFTLIELVVVLGIFTVMSMMAYGGLNSVLSARQHVAQSLERTTALQKAYLRLRNDLQQLRARPVRDGYGETQPALVLMHDGTVEFTRTGWRNPLSQPRSTLERVSYRVDDQKQLLRESWRVVDRAQDSVPVEIAVLDQVEQAEWRFLDSSMEWRTAWPDQSITGGAKPDAPPRAVELTLHLTDLGEVRLLFSAINATVPPSQSQQQQAPKT